MVFKESVKLLLLLILYVLIIFIALSLFGCGHGRQYRIYIHDAPRGFFIREDKEVLKYEEGHGLICMDKKNFYKFADRVATRKSGLCKKDCDATGDFVFYVFKPEENLFIRDKAQKEYLTHYEANNFRCIPEEDIYKLGLEKSI